jgi:hypothetical protein
MIVAAPASRAPAMAAEPDAAAADHRDGIAAAHRACVDGCAQSGN